LPLELLDCACTLSDGFKTSFGMFKLDPTGKGASLIIVKVAVAELSYFLIEIFTLDVPVFETVPAITIDLLLAVNISVKEAFEMVTLASEKLLAMYFSP